MLCLHAIPAKRVFAVTTFHVVTSTVLVDVDEAFWASFGVDRCPVVESGFSVVVFDFPAVVELAGRVLVKWASAVEARHEVAFSAHHTWMTRVAKHRYATVWARTKPDKRVTRQCDGHQCRIEELELLR